MSTEILNLEGGPLTTDHLKVVRYCCAKEVVENKLATDRRSILLTIDNPNYLGSYRGIDLTYNQAIMVAESILEALK